MNKKGFTLGEVMVTLAVLGILASILLPAVAHMRPNRNKALFKKAYYIAERMVYELVNDEDLYPTSEGVILGFDNVEIVPYGTESYSGNTKFCKLFARKLNTTDGTDKCDAQHSVPAGGGRFTEPSFTTTDGIAWYMPITNFKDASGKHADQTIYVDVYTAKSGRDTSNNCRFGETSCKHPDIFAIKVKPDGKMYVEGEKEKEYLESSTSLQ